MNRRANMKTPHYRRDIFSAVSLRFIFLFLLFTNISFSQTTNSKSEYDINDPRNPNCPCHKQQQLADEEYAQLNKKNHQNKNDKEKTIIGIDLKTTTDENVSSNLNQKQTKHTSYSGSGYSKRKKNNLWYRKTKFRIWNAFKKETKFNNRINYCFKW